MGDVHTESERPSEAITKRDEAWRPALTYIVESLGVCDRFATRDLYSLCGLEYEPAQAEGETASEFRRRFERQRRLFSTYMAEVKRELGESFRVDLRPTGEGAYEIVPHEKHVKVALRDTMRGVQNALSDGVRRVSSFDTARATDAQRREQADALARLDALQRMAKSRRAKKGG